MVSGINHITLAVSDLERSFRFYTRVVGLKPVAKWSGGAYLLAGEGWVCLSLDAGKRSEPEPEYTHIAFSVEKGSFNESAEAIRSHNVRIWKENQSEGDSLYFLDPDGHKLELHAGDLQTRLAALREQPYEGLELYV
ncbi:fosfomycin resistance glutathione transferase [Marinobacter bryozoorum]|uniref:fosfomycin resistance glutathione transferase n=1 Tax=Marinobacter bryozoorum TaxID=256324 RepID=UPI0020053156|nr:fosfomycin resistance glutathione transferase [Marinobacter bryozoorum]MCK7543596.1 fosfomycin resistance glutathione transferase [Marinobacter bryozoorum]